MSTQIFAHPNLVAKGSSLAERHNRFLQRKNFSGRFVEFCSIACLRVTFLLFGELKNTNLYSLKESGTILKFQTSYKSLFLFQHPWFHSVLLLGPFRVFRVLIQKPINFYLLV
jgi:hypothetical protein